nr:UDP-N-acetylmuramoyl-L-alanyl-D-glutamate--2,6-diaminopimelate ligase [Actinomycetota bacterium]
MPANPSGVGSAAGPGLPLRPRQPTPRPLPDLLAEVPGLRPAGDVASTLVTGCTLDSRAVQPGDLYAALPGA